MPDIVNLGGYTITFLGTQCIDELETWTYSIKKIGEPQPEIISWTLELCFNPLHNVLSSEGPGVVIIGQGKPCIPMVGRTIKWEQLNNDNVEGIYTFILEGCYQKSQKQVAIYAGPFCHRALITGPGCEEYQEDLFVEEDTEELENQINHQIVESSKEIEKSKNQLEKELSEEEDLEDSPPEFSTRGIKIF